MILISGSAFVTGVSSDPDMHSSVQEVKRMLRFLLIRLQSMA